MAKGEKDEQLYICKPCGYVMKESELGEVCPACGLPRKVFIEHKERMSPGRAKWLHLDLHPIAVHFPQTLLVLMIQALLINVFFPNFYPEVLLGSVSYTAVLFPFAVVGAFLSGLADGKMRFKSVMTPTLKKKIVWSSIMTIASVFTPFLAAGGVDTLQTKLLLIACGMVALVCGFVLGHEGKRLMNIGMGGAVTIWGRKF